MQGYPTFSGKPLIPAGARDGFVGRERELAALRRALAAVVDGHGRLVVLLGEPGIGKTRLAEQIASEAEAGGAAVLVGRAFPGEGAPAYWPWVTLLRQLAALAPAERVRAWLGTGAALIGQIAPDVPPPGPVLASPPMLDGDAARFRLFDAIATMLERAAAERPLVVVLDDVHWADEGSLRLLAFAARQLGRARVLFVATGRPVELRIDVPPAVREELARSAEYLEIGGLDVAEVAAVMRALSAVEPADALATMDPAEALAARVHEATDGNPFFVEAIVRALAVTGGAAAATAADLGALHLPDGVRDAVRARLRPLAADTRRVLTLAALLGRECAPSVLARVAALDVAAVSAALDDAERFGLVGPVLDGGRRRFTHALIVETLVADLPAAEQARLHRRIGDVLEPLAASGAATLDEVAAHYFAGVPAGAAEEAITCAEKAARGAAVRLGYEDAVRWYRRALAVLDATAAPAPARRVALLLQLGDAERRVGDAGAAQDTYRRAATIAAESGLPEARARAALGFGAGLGGFWDQSVGVVDLERVTLVRAALAALPATPSGLRALVMAQLSAALFWSSEPEQSARVPELGCEAIAMATASAAPTDQLAVLAAAHWTTWGPDDLAGRIARATDIVKRATELELPETILRGRMYLAAHRLESGDAAAADQEIARFSALATEWGLTRQLWYVQVYRGMRAHLEGRFADVARAAQEGLALGASAQPIGARFTFEAQEVLVAREQGRAEATVAALERTVAAVPGMPIWASALAVALVESGAEAGAQRVLDRLAADDFAGVPRNFLWLYTMTHLCRVAAALDDRVRAAVLYELLLPFAERVAVAQHGVLCDGAVARYLGLVATTLERFDDADRHCAAALAINERIGARIFTSATQVEHAVLLRRRGGRGDAARADTLLAAARATAETLGQVALLERIAALAGGAAPLAPGAAPPGARPIAARPAVDECVVGRSGDDWSVTHAGRTFTLKDMIGVRYLLTLLRQADREVHALDLVTGDGTPRRAGDAGELLDDRARAAYRTRLAELAEELEEAQSFNDAGRSERAQAEIDGLTDELTRAVGLGGRTRRAGSDADRARLNVTRAVRRVIEAIAAEDAALGSDLERGVHTGTFCRYSPDPRLPVRWEISGS